MLAPPGASSDARESNAVRPDPKSGGVAVPLASGAADAEVGGLRIPGRKAARGKAHEIHVCSAVELSTNTPARSTNGRQSAVTEGVEPSGNGFGGRSASQARHHEKLFLVREMEEPPGSVPRWAAPCPRDQIRSGRGVRAVQRRLGPVRPGHRLLEGRAHDDDRGALAQALRTPLPHARHGFCPSSLGVLEVCTSPRMAATLFQLVW